MLTSFVYREKNPSSPALDSVWTIDVRRDCSGPLPYLTLPDGCLDLIYRQKRDASGKIDAAALLVAGPTNRPSTYFPSPGEEFIGVRFSPGWGGTALGLSATELAGSFVGAANLTPALGQLEKRLLSCATRTEAVQLLSGTAEGWAGRAEQRRRTLEAIRALRISGGRLSIEQTARLAGVSVRTLHRDIRQSAGLGPKALSRIFRFRQTLDRMGNESPMSLGELAYTAGYADQAHMTRDFQELGGFTPGECSGYTDRETDDGEISL